MSGCNNDTNRCRAYTKAGSRCTHDYGYGLLCHRHARMLCSAAADSFRFYRMESNAFRDLETHHLRLAAFEYLSAGRQVEKPTKASAYVDLVRKEMQVKRIASIDAIAAWISRWSGREVTTRQAGMAIRRLIVEGSIEREYKTETGGGVITLWRWVGSNDTNV